MLAEMRVLSLGYIKDQDRYKQYENIRDARDELGERILLDYKKYYKFAQRYDVSKKELSEQQDMYRLRQDGKDADKQRLEMLSEIMPSSNDNLHYKRISDEMFKLYASSENLSHTARDYAGIILSKLTENAVYTKPEYIDQAIKQGLCYEALKSATSGNTSSPEKIQELHARAQNLSENLTNLEMLIDKRFLKQRLRDEITPVRKFDNKQISLMRFAEHMDEYAKRQEEYSYNLKDISKSQPQKDIDFSM